MTDEEVGVLWRFYYGPENDPIIAVIRKLVEERARYYCADTALALRDFGIDPVTYESK